MTPLLGVWLDGALYFCTGSNERKAKNLGQNPQCVLTTGPNTLVGLDLVVEREAAQVSDKIELRAVADAYEAKYGARVTEPEGTWSRTSTTELGVRVGPGSAVRLRRR